MKNLGTVNKYKVLRETDLGYILEQNNEEYFLHRNETNMQTLKVNQIVDAFLYSDKKNRLALTLFTPLIEVNKIAFLEVVGVKEDIGVFFNIGISKDILFSKEDLPQKVSEWMKVGDYFLCELRARNDRLVLKPVSKNLVSRDYEVKEKLNVGDYVKGNVYRIVKEGINIVTRDFQFIFIFKANYRKNYRLGEEVDLKIIGINEEDYLGSINKEKSKQIQDDKKIILDYLINHNGVMQITEKSEPELINRLFNMSKSAFKNSLGNLYKEKIIEIRNDKIILIDESYFDNEK